jgi:U3 small nucleolar RNA-associated protein 14
MLNQNLNNHNISTEDQEKIIELFSMGKMSNPEIREKCISIRPFMETVFDSWENSKIKSFTLTSVGMAIGHANIKRLTGEFASLSIWIN